jgi:hypothetical protein
MPIVRDILRSIIALGGLGVAGWGLWEKDPSLAKIVVGGLVFAGMILVIALSNRSSAATRGKRRA